MTPRPRDDGGVGGGCIIGIGLFWVALIGLLGWWGVLIGAVGAVAVGFWLTVESIREVVK